VIFVWLDFVIPVPAMAGTWNPDVFAPMPVGFLVRALFAL
jgi:hypothetical protein